MTESDDRPDPGGPGEVVPGGDQTGEDAPVSVSRETVKEARKNRRKRQKLAAVAGVVSLLVAGTVVAVALKGQDSEPVVTTTTTTTTSTSTTTIPEVLATTAMPLTGIPVNGDDPATAALLNRPALVAKVDNDPLAMPHVGLEKADLVIELRVEGISRYMAVFHSQDVEKVGPVRSARTSDPDILGMFGRPLFVWSGGNRNVVKVIREVPFIQNESHDKVPDAYSRTKSKRAPHNLLADARKIFERAEQPPSVPQPVFSYRGPDDATPGLPVPGVSLRVGSSPSTFVWDDESGNWLRWANNREHVADGGGQLNVRNVVVLSTGYGRSTADRRSPEAQSVGIGAAWVFSGGTVQAGIWSRDSVDKGWTLTAGDGSVMTLLPGNTWVAMVDHSDDPVMLDAESVSGGYGLRR